MSFWDTYLFDFIDLKLNMHVPISRARRSLPRFDPVVPVDWNAPSIQHLKVRFLISKQVFLSN